MIDGTKEEAATAGGLAVQERKQGEATEVGALPSLARIAVKQQQKKKS